MITRPIMRYHGGKWVIGKWVIDHFPPHRTYLAEIEIRKKILSYVRDLSEDSGQSALDTIKAFSRIFVRVNEADMFFAHFDIQPLRNIFWFCDPDLSNECRLHYFKLLRPGAKSLHEVQYPIIFGWTHWNGEMHTARTIACTGITSIR